ncbi:hypothetical protein MMC07_000821 [Pseudocyphellaria aurata]|nr:hypothetical protein [Pseudocyphellaria aurata]
MIAISLQVEIDPPFAVGSASRGTPLNVVPMVNGTVTSEPGFSPSWNGKFVGTGTDFIHNDPDQKIMRLNAHVVVKDDESDALVYLSYQGIVDLTPEVKLILMGSPDAKTTDFGGSFIEMRFETGDEKLKDLEVGVFVGAGRFRVETGKPVVVEYKVSRVVRGGN